MELDLTRGSVLKNVVRFSLPYLLSYFLQTLYGMADLFIIGQYAGVEATTAVSVGSQVMHMLTVMIVGLAMGTTVSIAQAVGAKDHARTAAATGSTVTLFMTLSVLLTGLLLLLRGPIVSAMSTPEEAVSGAQNIGAGKPERAKKTLFCAIALACGFGAVVVALVQVIAEPVVGLFTPDAAAGAASTGGLNIWKTPACFRSARWQSGSI